MSANGRPRLVERTMDVLVALADGPASFGMVWQRTGLSKATVHRILGGLSHEMFVVQDPASGEYMLGPGCYRLVSALTLGKGGIGPISRPVLEELRELSGETIILHIRAGTNRICVEELPSPQALRYVAGLGSVARIHVGSAGKVLLAWLDDLTLRQLLPSELPKITNRTIVGWEHLRKELAAVRQQGWAQSAGERVIGAAAISAPIFGPASEVLASVSILGPEARLDAARLEELRAPLLATARSVSELLQASSAAKPGLVPADDVGGEQ